MDRDVSGGRVRVGGIALALLAAGACVKPTEASDNTSALAKSRPKRRDAGVVCADAGVAAPVRVAVEPLSIDVPDGAGGFLTLEVPVEHVDVELIAAAAASVPMRVRTPVVEVDIPPVPARRARPVVTEVEIPVCMPGTATRARPPAIEVTVPEGCDVPRRVRTPAIEVTVPEGSPMVPTRVRIPAIDVNVPVPEGDVPRRVATPAIDVGVFDPGDAATPTRVLVPVPEEGADLPTRVRVPVSAIP
jgi:hypothetical protein